MATDKSEPKIKWIFGIAIACAFTLLCVRIALTSYFDIEVDRELYAKRGSLPHPELNEVRQEDKQLLTNSKMPIDKAMEVFASQGRPAAMSPQESQDMGAITQRWKELPPPPPPPAPLPAMAQTAEASTATPTAVGDAGAIAADAGALPGKTHTPTNPTKPKAPNGPNAPKKP